MPIDQNQDEFNTEADNLGGVNEANVSEYRIYVRDHVMRTTNTPITLALLEEVAGDAGIGKFGAYSVPGDQKLRRGDFQTDVNGTVTDTGYRGDVELRETLAAKTITL